MSGLSRSQIVVYAAIAIAVLLVGARWVRSGDPPAAAGDPPGDRPATAADGGFALDRGADGGLIVHVAGAVRQAGVYRLPAGSRVTDAIERAGGPGADGELNAINLAAPLADGQQVVVPARAATGTSAAPEQSGPVSLGTATAEELDEIEGIGPVTAADILEYRDERGGLASIDQLDEISGIGPATMEALRDSLQP